MEQRKLNDQANTLIDFAKMQIRVSDMLSAMSACNEKLEDQVTSMNSRLDILEQNVNRLPDLFSNMIQLQFKKYFDDPEDCRSDHMGGPDCYDTSSSVTPPTPKKLPSLRGSRRLRRGDSNLSSVDGAGEHEQLYESPSPPAGAIKHSSPTSKSRFRGSSQRIEKVPSTHSINSETSEPSEKTRSTILYTPTEENKQKHISNFKSQKQLL